MAFLNQFGFESIKLLPKPTIGNSLLPMRRDWPCTSQFDIMLSAGSFFIRNGFRIILRNLYGAKIFFCKDIHRLFYQTSAHCIYGGSLQHQSPYPEGRSSGETPIHLWCVKIRFIPWSADLSLIAFLGCSQSLLLSRCTPEAPPGMEAWYIFHVSFGLSTFLQISFRSLPIHIGKARTRPSTNHLEKPRFPPQSFHSIWQIPFRIVRSSRFIQKQTSPMHFWFPCDGSIYRLVLTYHTSQDDPRT